MAAESANPTTLAEIVEIIVQHLPWRYLGTASQVCRLWNDTVRKIRRSRRHCVAYLSPRCSKFSEFSKSMVDFIERQRIEPKGALLFTSSLPSSSVAFLKTFATKVRRRLPKNCPLVGCTGLGVVGTDSEPAKLLEESSISTSALRSREEEMRESLSLLLLPSREKFEVEDFHIPLRNKYKRIRGVKSFLPNTTLPVRMVVVLAHPLSLGKLTDFTVSVRQKYGDEVSSFTL